MMSGTTELYIGRRLSYDGALSTVRSLIREGQIPGTKGDWLGIEWDDSTRGKHNGTYQGHHYFDCQSSSPTAASFIRPSRKRNSEKTVLEAIRSKYDAIVPEATEVVVISGKVAQEIGFDKIAKEQSVLADLRVVLLDKLVVSGVAPRGSSPKVAKQARDELAKTCPNIVELDLGYNPIETWAEIDSVGEALPQLKVLKLNGLRLDNLDSKVSSSVFPKLQELHLNECLIEASSLIQILGSPDEHRFPSLHTLWLSQNELNNFVVPKPYTGYRYDTIKSLVLENNFFKDLNFLVVVFSVFPRLCHISLQGNLIEHVGGQLLNDSRNTSKNVYNTLDTLNLSQNKICSFEFIDKLPGTFPNLQSLRVSKNPVYDEAYPATPSANPSETNYYLTLARIPRLKTLNYTNITARERDEGEIYYLSIIEKEIKAVLTEIDLNNPTVKEQYSKSFQVRFPLYQPLCEKHDRESLLAQLAATSDPSASSKLVQATKVIRPPGSLASRLAHTSFYIPESETTKEQVFSQSIPTTIATTQIFALVARAFSLLPLQFKLVYESPELDPVRDDLTTRSQVHDTSNPVPSGKTRYEEWGDWDVDDLVSSDQSAKDDDDAIETHRNEGRWNEQGYLIRDGRKWKRREVEILMGMRAWGDYLDLDGGTGNVKVKVEPRKGALREEKLT